MFNQFNFSGGEVHVKADENQLATLNIKTISSEDFKYAYGTATITLRDYTMNGFMGLCLKNEVLRRHPDVCAVNVVIPYLPYARQDRIMETGEPFSLKVFCDLLNSQKFDRVTIYDPHSDVGPALINNCVVVPQWEIVPKLIPQSTIDYPEYIWVSPDAGSYKKLSKLIHNDDQIVVGVKHRSSDGTILRTDVLTRSNQTVKNKMCFIVDDICDGGRTFTELAKVLYKMGATCVVLIVTHGIFSKGISALDGIEYVRTTNSFDQMPHPRLITTKLF